MWYKAILLFFINVLFVKSLSALETKTKNYLNQDYDLFKALYNNNYVYFYKNNNILNLAPKLNINGLNYREISINGVSNNFLNLPINNIPIISPSFFTLDYNKSTFLSRNSLNNIELYFYGDKNLSVEEERSKLNINFSNKIFSNGLTTDNNIIGSYDNENVSFLLAVNYMHVGNYGKSDNFADTNIPMNRYNNIISFQYIPKDKNVSLKFTNFNFYYHAKRDIRTNERAKFYFGNNFLKQVGFGNFFITSYEVLFDDQSLWNYYSHIAISNQWLSINNQHNFIKDKSVYYENIDYKVQNISSFNNFFYNKLFLTYGIKLERQVTKNNIDNKNFTWPKGVENYYSIFLDSNINFLNANILYINPAITLKHYVYKSNEHNSYRLDNIDPKLNIVLHLTKNINLYGTYLYNERLPYIYEKYINGSYFFNDYFIKFNPNYNLKKQKDNHWDGGLYASFNVFNNIDLEANFNTFYYKNKNHIDYKFLDKSNIEFTNLEYAILSGYKATLGIKVYNLETKIIYNTLKGKDNNGNYLNSLYPNNIIIDSSFKLSTVNLIVGMKAKLFDKFSNYSCNYPFEKFKLPGYSVFDIYFEYKGFKNNLSLIMGIENILNKKYQVPYILKPYQDRRYFYNFTLKL